MAEKSEKKAEEKGSAAAGAGARGSVAKAAVEGKASGGGLMKSTPALLGVVMILEAVVLFAGFKYMNMGPASAKGAELGNADGKAAKAGGNGGSAKINSKKLVELKVVDFKAPNKHNGRGYLYDVSIYAATKSEFKEKVETAITERDALIKDRIRTIIAQCDPEKLGGAEPELVTLRRQIKSQLEEILGEGMVEEVLVPRCIQYRMDY
ncbi:MAG: hypothetical protein NTU53_25945 [Planctomycetota bacterium]|nr:hypothetical protein [Planctomycetota bacterium]